ncbi:hypothetical protein HGRIS_007586 [Hohenbuehelia grisea]|uniref:Uncharacterized protein n=1 Tax=Hohenbuehelia grisea TaxID=104357 RepID=A0ABR3J5A1_9AGAR
MIESNTVVQGPLACWRQFRWCNLNNEKFHDTENYLDSPSPRSNDSITVHPRGHHHGHPSALRTHSERRLPALRYHPASPAGDHTRSCAPPSHTRLEKPESHRYM